MIESTFSIVEKRLGDKGVMLGEADDWMESNACRTTGTKLEPTFERPSERADERPEMAGKRPLAGHDLSDFGLLRHLERVVYLNPEVTHCTFKFRMA